MRGLFRNQAGNVSIMLALASVPLFGAAGVGVDYLRIAAVKSGLQSQADAAALGAAAASNTTHGKKWIAKTASDAAEQLGGMAQDVTIDGDWISAKDFQVTASADVALSLLGVFPNLPNPVKINIKSVARLQKSVPTYQPPTVASLDPSAADYNRIYVYCFNPDNQNNADEGRSQETAIADNAGTSYNYQMPECQAGELLSYRLYNVRNAHNTPAVWDSGSATRYNWYTDTTLNNAGAETYNLDGYPLVETVLCNNTSQCKGTSQGGIIPEGANRTPQQATQACSTGKYIYYGWEDRPPGLGWTDQDYNDIRIVIACPSWSNAGSKSVRLIK